MLISKAPDIHKKLAILSQDSQYDLACACGTGKDDRRKKSVDDKWIYPVTLPQGGKSVLFKSLVSNVCVNDCSYCPLRQDRDPERCSLSPSEIATAFMDYYRKGKVFGLFLSSGVTSSPDNSMERMITAARILRYRENFRGFMHIKIIPGASTAAIEETLKLSSAVSLNIEVPTESSFAKLSSKKNYSRDIISPLKYLSRMTQKGTRYERVGVTTQFIVGASTETDSEIVKCSGALYQKLKFDRIYFSAYQRGLGATNLPGEKSTESNKNILMREHRLYQTDFLMRQYKFTASEIPFTASGQLGLDIDPKEAWAINHPEFFPVNINNADYYSLIRVPGIGPVAAKRILALRKQGSRVREIGEILKTRNFFHIQKCSSFIRI